jgi:ADP-dependent NAD(P)H-hydrate dehydratase / NAD(P)H-hydrate epimerase
MNADVFSATPVTWEGAPALLRAPLTSDDKYSRGVLGMVTGSAQYPGAALLGITAALSTGVGMVRYVGPGEVASLVLATRPEVVIGAGRVHALVVGSGFPDTSSSELRGRLGALDGVDVPVVLDAGAMIARDVFPGSAILTPHRGELDRLADAFGAPQGPPQQTALWLAHHVNAVVVLKGNDTLVVSPDGRASQLPPAPTWLATAGTGDVLAGIMGAVVTAVVTAHPDHALSVDHLHDAAVVAALIHRQAAIIASHVGGAEAPLLPSDLAEAVREAVAGFLSR